MGVRNDPLSHQYQKNSNTETMNSMIMSSRKALVAKPTQSRRVASKATRRPVAMAGMQVLKPEKRYECLSYLPPLSDEEISRQIDYPSATDGLHASSSPARRRPTPTSSSS